MRKFNKYFLSFESIVEYPKGDVWTSDLIFITLKASNPGLHFHCYSFLNAQGFSK